MPNMDTLAAGLALLVVGVAFLIGLWRASRRTPKEPTKLELQEDMNEDYKS